MPIFKAYGQLHQANHTEGHDARPPDNTRSLFVAPCAGVLGRIPSVLSGKTPAWEQSGGKKHKGAAASWSDSIPVCVDLTELLQGLEYFGFIVVRIVY